MIVDNVYKDVKAVSPENAQTGIAVMEFDESCLDDRKVKIGHRVGVCKPYRFVVDVEMLVQLMVVSPSLAQETVVPITLH